MRDFRDIWNNTKGLVDDVVSQLQNEEQKERETSTIVTEMDEYEVQLKDIVSQLERLQSLTSHGIAGASLSKVAGQADELRGFLDDVHISALDRRIRQVQAGILRTKLQKLEGIKNHAEDLLGAVDIAVQLAMQTKISAARQELGDVSENKAVLYQSQIVDLLVEISEVRERVREIQPPYTPDLLRELQAMRRHLHASHPSKIVESARFEGLSAVAVAATAVVRNYEETVIELEALGDIVRRELQKTAPPPPQLERAREITENRLLVADLLQAQYLARQMFDQDDFHQRLTKIIDAPEDLYPELTLLNQIAKRKAKLLLNKEKQWF